MSSLDDDLNTFRVFNRPSESGDALSGAASPDEDEAASQEAASPTIDLQALADKVYALLKQELRLEQERLGRRRLW
jgi:hypothetical protein